MSYDEIINNIKEGIKNNDTDLILKLFTFENVKTIREGKFVENKLSDRVNSFKEFFPSMSDLSKEEILTIFKSPLSEEEISKLKSKK